MLTRLPKQHQYCTYSSVACTLYPANMLIMENLQMLVQGLKLLVQHSECLVPLLCSRLPPCPHQLKLLLILGLLGVRRCPMDGLQTCCSQPWQNLGQPLCHNWLQWQGCIIRQQAPYRQVQTTSTRAAARHTTLPAVHCVINAVHALCITSQLTQIDRSVTVVSPAAGLLP